MDEIVTRLKSELQSASDLTAVNDLFLKYVGGKNSEVNKLTELISKATKEERGELGKKFNSVKNEVNKLIEDKKIELLSKADQGEGWFDITLPVKRPVLGRLSTDTEVIREMNEFFIRNGFSVAEGPDIELDLYNFEKTNLPKDHPARDLQDTIYIEGPEILLRTHTSSVETRILSEAKPPYRFVVPGVSFRNEIVSPSNHAVFQQYQGVVVDKGISMANLKATLEGFAKHMYGDSIQTRFRAKYYPEVEPGAGLDILCTFCHGVGCRICKERGWIEILGSGMIHRNLLEKCGIDYNEWSGFAFGMGLSRIIMTKAGINDIRDLHGGNLVYEDTL
jgi:phenylalanyl-tRNA synthetase alpha chain